MSKLCCEPKEDMSVRSFFEPESNANLQPKRRKATEKKTPLTKSVNTKILSRQEAHLKLHLFFFLSMRENSLQPRLCLAS